MPLITIRDLEQSQDVLDPYIKEAQKLQEMYFKYIADSQSDNYAYQVDIHGSSGRRPGIHASEISNCMRVIVYSLMGTERRPSSQNTDVNMLMRFRHGHAVHAMLQSDWHKIAERSDGRVRFDSELKINPTLQAIAAEWNIQSSCDGVITLCDEMRQPWLRMGLEIKTESDGQYTKLGAPRPKHVEQTTVYMAALDLPLMWTLYYNKSNSNFTPSCAPFLFRFNKALWEQELEVRFARATHLAETRALPDRTEGMECKWCPFAYTCMPTILNQNQKPKISKGLATR